MITKHRRADQCGRAEIDFRDDEREQQSDDDEWNDEACRSTCRVLFITREPPREKKDHGDLRDFRWLKCDRTGADPAA